MKRHVLTALLLCVVLCLPALAMAEGEAKPMMDIVWVVDCTGSMSKGYISYLQDFHAQLTDFDVRYGLVAFGDEFNNVRPNNYDYPEYTKKILFNGSDWTSDIDLLKNSSNNLPNYLGGADSAETSTSGLYKAATEYTWRENAIHAIVLVTDATYKSEGMSNATGNKVPSMGTVVEMCKEKGISMSLLDCGFISYAYHNDFQSTGGIWKNYNNSKESMEQIAQWIYNTPIVITQPQNIKVYEGSAVTFTAESHGKKPDNSVVNYEWFCNKQSKSTGSTTGKTSLTLNDVTTEMNNNKYSCRFTNTATGDTRYIDTNTVTLEVLSTFTINQHPASQSAEVGSDVSFTVQASGDGLTYQWEKLEGGTWTTISDGNGVTGATSATLHLNPVKEDNAGTYHCVVKDSMPSTLTSNPATLSVHPTLSFTKDLSNVDVDEGTQVIFAVDTVGYDVTYQWQRKKPGSDWANVSATGNTLDLGEVSVTDSGSMFRCIATSGLNTTKTSEEVTLTVAALPTVSSASGEVFTEAGKEAQFSVQAPDGMTLQWQEEVNGVWTEIAGETGDTLTVTASPENNGRQYRCVVKNRRGTETTSQPATLTVADAPAITAQPQSLRVAVGEGAEFTVEATGYELRYQWQVLADGIWTDCPNGQAKTLTLSALKLTDDGSVYRCVVRSGFGTELISDEVTLTVVALPDLPETGDSSRLGLWAALCAACMLGLAALRRRA